MMSDRYIELLILSYFKEYDKQYALADLKEKIGISFKLLDEYLDKLISERKLVYKQSLLSLSKEGRIYLANSELENYAYSADLEKKYSREKWDLDKIYCVQKFSQKKWRGSKE